MTPGMEWLPSELHVFASKTSHMSLCSWQQWNGLQMSTGWSWKSTASTVQGLPSDWDHTHLAAGTFSTGGQAWDFPGILLSLWLIIYIYNYLYNIIHCILITATATLPSAEILPRQGFLMFIDRPSHFMRFLHLFTKSTATSFRFGSDL